MVRSRKQHKHSKNRSHRRMKKGGKQHHTKKFSHRRMRGGNNLLALAPAPFSLGGPSSPPSSNFIFNAADYGSNVVPTSSTPTPPTTEMTGGRRHRHRHMKTKKHQHHRGGSTTTYSFLPPGSGLSAKDSGMANVAPYSVYDHKVQAYEPSSSSQVMPTMSGGKRRKFRKGGVYNGSLYPDLSQLQAESSSSSIYRPTYKPRESSNSNGSLYPNLSSNMPSSMASNSSGSLYPNLSSNMGGKRRHHKKYRGGLGYSFLAPGSLEINAKNSGMTDVAPYTVYNE